MTRPPSATELTLQNDDIRVVVLPKLGAKVVSLVARRSGREWLDQPRSTRGREQLDRRLGDEFGADEAFGWDECFPSIAAGRYSVQPSDTRQLFDHGELWSRQWSAELEETTLRATIDGVSFRYRFERRLSLEGATLRADYLIRNLGREPLPCLWAMHPLFAAKPGMRIVLPEMLRLQVASDDAHEREIASNVLTLRAPEPPRAAKLFSDRLEVGRAALHDPEGDEWIGLEFDASTIPYLGVWVNEGRWPDPDGGLYHVALEPTTGSADDLTIALDRGGVPILPADGTLFWQVTLCLGTGSSALMSFVDSRLPLPRVGVDPADST